VFFTITSCIKLWDANLFYSVHRLKDLDADLFHLAYSESAKYMFLRSM
jgi:hypothetical protein